ncbi:MAG: hypothetical protein HOO91_06590 [Bacteroidales bacterium]|nr:hypothetical protein [Bacteroidales bacterium]
MSKKVTKNEQNQEQNAEKYPPQKSKPTESPTLNRETTAKEDDLIHKTSRTTFWDWLTRISVVVTILGVLGLWFAYNDYKNTNQEKIEKKIEAASSEFKKNAKYEKSLELFREILREKPDDLTGYNMFLQKAKEQRVDYIKKDFLEWAKSLHPTPNRNEANDLLKQYQ